MKRVDNIIVSLKAGKRVVTPGKRKVYKNGKPIVMQEGILVPRGALHEATVYGKITSTYPDEMGRSKTGEKVVVRYKLGVGRDCIFSGKEKIEIVYDKKTACSVIKDGIKESVSYIIDKQIQRTIIDAINEEFPEEETYLTAAENALKDGQAFSQDCKKVLERIKQIDSRPIYFDAKKTIPIRSARCDTRLKTIEPLKYRDSKAISFVKSGNNHHVALYTDFNGKTHETIVTFWHAVERAKYHIPVVIENPRRIWDYINEHPQDYPQEFLEKLPDATWKFNMSFQQNDMFVLGMSDKEFYDAVKTNARSKIAKFLYRVQSISAGDYWFRYHTETENDKTASGKDAKKYYRIISIGSFKSLNPHKVKVTLLGEIIV